MSGECQVNVKSQSELDIGGRETYLTLDLVLDLALSIVNCLVTILLGLPVIHCQN